MRAAANVLLQDVLSGGAMLARTLVWAAIMSSWFLVSDAEATVTYDVAIDTSALKASVGQLYFQIAAVDCPQIW